MPSPVSPASEVRVLQTGANKFGLLGVVGRDRGRIVLSVEAAATASNVA